MPSRPFLTARWSDLGVITYAVDPGLLKSRTPPGLEPDSWPDFPGKALVSLVAFDFLDTRVRGLRIPGHVNFPEVNLRFYVRNPQGVPDDAGVCFIRELVPRRAVAWIARLVYNEPYHVARMRSRAQQVGESRRTEHRISRPGCSATIALTARRSTHIPAEGSLERFLTQKLWGYGIDRRGRTLRYRVDHPVWELHDQPAADLRLDFASLYGSAWRVLNESAPVSVILAKGSQVRVDPHSTERPRLTSPAPGS